MLTSPDTVRQVLRSWLATEVLTPQVTKDGWSGLAADKQGQQRNKAATTSDDPAQWEIPGDDDPTPWPLLVEKPEAETGEIPPPADESAPDPDQVRPWYSVVLAALPAKQAFERLDAAFSDEADDDEINRRTQGYIVAATAVLDEWGVLVPDTMAIASFAWGLGHMLGGGSAAALAGWSGQEQELRRRGSKAGHTGARVDAGWADW